MFFGEVGRVMAGEGVAGFAADRFAKVVQKVGGGLVVVSAALFDQFGCFANEPVRVCNHLLHSLLPIRFLFLRIAFGLGGFLFLLFQFCGLRQLFAPFNGFIW